MKKYALFVIPQFFFLGAEMEAIIERSNLATTIYMCCSVSFGVFGLVMLHVKTPNHEANT